MAWQLWAYSRMLEPLFHWIIRNGNYASESKETISRSRGREGEDPENEVVAKMPLVAVKWDFRWTSLGAFGQFIHSSTIINPTTKKDLFHVSFCTPQLQQRSIQRPWYCIFLRGAIRDSNSTLFTETDKNKEEIIWDSFALSFVRLYTWGSTWGENEAVSAVNIFTFSLSINLLAFCHECLSPMISYDSNFLFCCHSRQFRPIASSPPHRLNLIGFAAPY